MPANGTSTALAKPAGSTAVAQQGPAQQFKSQATSIAKQMLREWVGEERASEAIGRITCALTAAATAARDPGDFYACTPASIATCVALSALTGLMPGVGSSALAYVLPQRARAGEAPQLQYSLSHRGLNALARRCGQTMLAIPISVRDVIEVDQDGSAKVISRDIDNPPFKMEELRGVLIVVKEIASGVVLSREYMPRSLIEKRRDMSRSWQNEKARQYSPWWNWPIEMAMKTAMKYAIGRGWCVIDDTEASRALSADDTSDLGAATSLGGDVIPAVGHVTGVEAAKQALGVKASSESTGPSEDVKYWLGLIEACKDEPHLTQLHGEFDEVREGRALADVEAIEAAFASRLEAVVAK